MLRACSCPWPSYYSGEKHLVAYRNGKNSRRKWKWRHLCYYHMTKKIYTSYLKYEVFKHSICTEASQQGHGRTVWGKLRNGRLFSTGDFIWLQQLSCSGDIRKTVVYQLFNMNLQLKTRRNEHQTPVSIF